MQDALVTRLFDVLKKEAEGGSPLPGSSETTTVTPAEGRNSTPTQAATGSAGGRSAKKKAFGIEVSKEVLAAIPELANETALREPESEGPAPSVSFSRGDEQAVDTAVVRFVENKSGSARRVEKFDPRELVAEAQRDNPPPSAKGVSPRAANLGGVRLHTQHTRRFFCCAPTFFCGITAM